MTHLRNPSSPPRCWRGSTTFRRLAAVSSCGSWVWGAAASWT